VCDCSARRVRLVRLVRLSVCCADLGGPSGSAGQIQRDKKAEEQSQARGCRLPSRRGVDCGIGGFNLEAAVHASGSVDSKGGGSGSGSTSGFMYVYLGSYVRRAAAQLLAHRLGAPVRQDSPGPASAFPPLVPSASPPAAASPPKPRPRPGPGRPGRGVHSSLCSRLFSDRGPAATRQGGLDGLPARACWSCGSGALLRCQPLSAWPCDELSVSARQATCCIHEERGRAAQSMARDEARRAHEAEHVLATNARPV